MTLKETKMMDTALEMVAGADNNMN